MAHQFRGDSLFPLRIHGPCLHMKGAVSAGEKPAFLRARPLLSGATADGFAFVGFHPSFTLWSLLWEPLARRPVDRKPRQTPGMLIRSRRQPRAAGQHPGGQAAVHRLIHFSADACGCAQRGLPRLRRRRWGSSERELGRWENRGAAACCWCGETRAAVAAVWHPVG